MADLLRIRRRPAVQRGLTAAAKILATTRLDEPQPENWHEPAWAFRNTTGEVRYAEMWLGNSMARARLVAARRERPGAEPEPLEESHPASELVARLAGGVGGQAALLRSFATYMLTPGIGYLVGHDPSGPSGWMFQVRSADEVRLSTTRDPQSGRPMYEVATGDQANDWVRLGENGLVVKVYRPDPQRHWRPDSPVRGALPILEELSLLTQAIAATATSRLAGAGLLPLPQEMQHDDGWEKFIAELLAHFTTPIKNRASASAYAPFPFKVPGAYLDKIKPVMFASLFDEHAMKLREELIHRLATAMDMPVRTLTGEQENHWGKAATADEGVKLHTIPNLELVCDGLTIGYLQPALALNNLLDDAPSQPQLLYEASHGTEIVDADGAEIIVWYDLSDFTARPDKGADAQAAYDRFEVTGETLRAETGLSEAEPPDDEELARRVWLTLIDKGSDAALVTLALRKLNLATPDELPAAPSPPGEDPVNADEPEPPGQPPELPEPTPATEPSDPAPSDRPVRVPAVAAAATADPAVVAVLAAADALVHRALERCGNRLRTQIARRSPGRRLPPDLDLAAHLMHTACNAAATQPLDVLLEGAWDRLPEVATNLGQDPTVLRDTLEAYTRDIIRARTPHSWQLLGHRLAARANGHGPAIRATVLTHADAVLAAVGRERT